MKINRIDHVGVVVNDLAGAKAFFLDFGLEVQGEGELEGAWLDRIVGLNSVKVAYMVLRTPDGQANIELIKFHTPSDERDSQLPYANTLGIRHIAFAVEDIEAVVAKLKKKGTDVFSVGNAHSAPVLLSQMHFCTAARLGGRLAGGGIACEHTAAGRIEHKHRAWAVGCVWGILAAARVAGSVAACAGSPKDAGPQAAGQID